MVLTYIHTEYSPYSLVCLYCPIGRQAVVVDKVVGWGVGLVVHTMDKPYDSDRVWWSLVG